MNSEVLDVDMLAFERGSSNTKQAVVDGVMKSLETGFVYTSHDMSQVFWTKFTACLANSFQNQLCKRKQQSFEGTNGQRGYTGLLVETAAISVSLIGRRCQLGKIYLQGIRSRSGIRRFFNNVFPEDLVPGITGTLEKFHDQILDLQLRFLRIIALGLKTSKRSLIHLFGWGNANEGD